MKKLLCILATLLAPIVGRAQATNLITFQWQYDPSFTNEASGFRLYSADVLPTNSFPAGWTVVTNTVGLHSSGTNQLPLLVAKSQKFYTLTTVGVSNFWGGPIESVPSSVASTPSAPVAPTPVTSGLGIRKGP